MAERPETIECDQCGGPVDVAPRGALPKRHAPGKCDTPPDADTDPDTTPAEDPEPAAPTGPVVTRVQVAPYAYEMYSDGVLVGRFEGCAG